eukprot:415329_1
MADALIDEQKPLRPLESKSNIVSDNEEEEKKDILIIPSYQNQSYQHKLSYDSDNSSTGSSYSQKSNEDIVHSNDLLCRIALFLYVFISILLSVQFPDETTMITARYRSWFKFFMSVNIIACILGTIGVYLNKPKLLFICWILNAISVCLLGTLVISYIFITGDEPNYEGIELESRNRCYHWIHDENENPMQNNYPSIGECLPKMRLQVLWTVGLLYVIYLIACSSGIYVMRKTSIHMSYHNRQHAQERYDSYSYEDDRSDVSLSNLSDAYQQIDDEPYKPGKKKKSSYDIPLDDLEVKKNK